MSWLLADHHWMIVAGAYLLGSVLAAPLLAHCYGFDLRQTGSGNPGFSNLKRQTGWSKALPALLWDLGKGTLAVLFGQKLGGEAGAQWAALAVIIGHCFALPRPWLGGKGVATFMGALLWLAPQAALAGMAVWLVLAKFVKISSVASLTAVAVATGVCLALRLPAADTAMLAAAVIFVRHRSNLLRLAKSREPQL